MNWLYGEPSLDDVLADPVIRALMERDRVDGEFLRALARDLRRASGEAWAWASADAGSLCLSREDRPEFVTV